MLIKSQDKDSMIKADDNFHIWFDKYGIGNDKYKYVIRFNGYILGEYSTTEKAHEILNEIQLELLAESKIYLMPQDDEVEV